MKIITTVVSLWLVCVSGVVQADAEQGKVAYAAKGCIGCHGAGGISMNAAYPSLNGQTVEYIRQSLVELRSGERKNPVMNAMAVNLSDDDINNLADYIATLP